MGAALSSQIPSLELYLSDLDEKYTIERPLGFSKFLKTLQCVTSVNQKVTLKVYIKRVSLPGGSITRARTVCVRCVARTANLYDH